MATAPNWVVVAEAALNGDAKEEVEVVPHHRPPLLDAFARRALLTPFIAAFLWAAVAFRETLRSPLEPLALVLRLLALALTVRSLLLLGQLGQRFAIAIRRSRYGLALAPEGLLYRTPDADFAVAKEDVVGVHEPGNWRERGGARWSEVYVITRPSAGRAYLVVPPVLDSTPGVLAERLMRWRGVVTAPERPKAPDTDLPSKLFDAAARGDATPGVLTIRHGRAWLHRAPYATVLLGIALLDGYLRLPGALRDRVGGIAPAVIALCLGVVPLGWLVLVRLSMAPQQGVALLLTPAELLLRTRAGVIRVRHADLGKLEITARTGWSMIRGTHDARTLIIHRKNDQAIRYAEPYLGAPAEVVVALCEAYRKGVLP